MTIRYRLGGALDLDEVIEVYRASTLGERRPIDDVALMKRMVDGANLIVTAWDDELLVGIARSVSDFAYVTYLSDLAVRASHQRRGIGRELVAQTRRAGGPDARIVLLAAPAAREYYAPLGFVRHDSAWVLPEERSVSN